MEWGTPVSSIHEVSQARTLEWVCHFFLQGIFLVQGSNSRLLLLLHCWQILYCCAIRDAKSRVLYIHRKLTPYWIYHFYLWGKSWPLNQVIMWINLPFTQIDSEEWTGFLSPGHWDSHSGGCLLRVCRVPILGYSNSNTRKTDRFPLLLEPAERGLGENLWASTFLGR